MISYNKNHFLRSIPSTALNFSTPTQVNQNGSHDAPTIVAPTFIPEQYAKQLSLISPSTSTIMTNIIGMPLICFSILSKMWMIDYMAFDSSSLLTSSSTLNSPKNIVLLNGNARKLS